MHESQFTLLSFDVIVYQFNLIYVMDNMQTMLIAIGLSEYPYLVFMIIEVGLTYERLVFR